jgi:hypothetical protein
MDKPPTIIPVSIDKTDKSTSVIASREIVVSSDSEENQKTRLTSAHTRSSIADWCRDICELGTIERNHIILKAKHGNADDDSAVVQCALCQYTCAGLTRMRIHLTAHGYREASIRDMVKIIDAQTFFECESCGYEAEKKVTLKNHKRLKCRLGHYRVSNY